MNDLYIARQPIYDRKMEVVGYELLFRDGVRDQAALVDADLATRRVLQTAFVDIGLDSLVGQGKAFINFTRNLLLQDDDLQLPVERLVLELPAGLDANGEIVDAIRHFRERGGQVALDHVSPNLEPELIGEVDLLKVDVSQLSLLDLPDKVSEWQASGCRVVALRVESQALMQACQRAGFDLFQGFFFCRPELVQGKSLPANRLATLQLLSRLQSPATELAELEQIIGQDVSLSYRLLRYLNSVQFGLRSKVESIGHAVSYLGLDNLRVWASIMLLARLDDKPRELMKIALVRARMCELLNLLDDQPGEGKGAFLVGLFSTLDALLDQPLDDILQELPLSETIQQALLEGDGPFGTHLTTVLAYEQGEWDRFDQRAYPSGEVARCYLEAVCWGESAMQEMRAA